jgi:hypothetical protein
VAYTLDSAALDFDASPSGYEVPSSLEVDFDLTTLPSTEQGEIIFSFNSALFGEGAASVNAQTLLNLTANLLSNRFLRLESSMSLAATLLENFNNVRTTFAALTTPLSAAQLNTASANIQSSAGLDLSATQAVQARASALGEASLALVLSYFYASLASCFPETAFQSILSAINAHFVHGYAGFSTGVMLGSTYVKTIHYNADYIESVISYTDVLGVKFDLGIVSNDGRIVRLQVKDNVVKISFNDRLSDVNGLFEKTLIIQPSTRIIDIIASEKLGSTG